MSSPEAPLSVVFAPDARHEGDLSFEGRVRVDGTFVGRLYTEEVLEIGETGAVEGEVDVARATVAGRFEGRLRCREHLRLTATADVSGELDIGILECASGARLRGTIHVRGRELP
jgi:cytoskeletal protein CcmA (bactofilin family)